MNSRETIQTKLNDQLHALAGFMPEMAQPSTVNRKLDGYGMSCIHGTVPISASFPQCLGTFVRTQLLLYYPGTGTFSISILWRWQKKKNT
jgi:hypothetical protein